MINYKGDVDNLQNFLMIGLLSRVGRRARSLSEVLLWIAIGSLCALLLLLIQHDAEQSQASGPKLWTVGAAILAAIPAVMSAVAGWYSAQAATASLRLTEDLAVRQSITARNLAFYAQREMVYRLEGGTVQREDVQADNYSVVYEGLNSIKLDAIDIRLVQPILSIKILVAAAYKAGTGPDAVKEDLLRKLKTQMRFLDNRLTEKGSVYFEDDCTAFDGAKSKNTRASCLRYYDAKP
ncbi:hypothetical protein IVB14_17715 [Bradyrhizobium sp. 180]|uniref:hypothetical protein n=1 Tax=Bradyrhizobium sp. 180 TaxID=2782650 RepID=UPI001FF7C9F8|nr:hypothetical protein [Bradyrhizobium sp. 180]MCK1492209.1 hypothetical protein [Bradyrhizobium sp. 180]